jgi:hypothetical protein
MLKIHQGKGSFVRFSLAGKPSQALRIADSPKLWLLPMHLMVTVLGLNAGFERPVLTALGAPFVVQFVGQRFSMSALRLIVHRKTLWRTSNRF